MPIVKKETKPIKKAEKKEKISKAKKTKIPAEKGGFAVIEAGGKQYRVFVGDVIKIEIIKGEHKEGDQIVFDKVLLIDNGKDVTDIGTPYIEGAKVIGTLSEIGRNHKVTVIKYKQKSRYLKKNGHRQPYFKIKIDKIS
ncbi:MAG: 50S ribosomal protein L21 [Candidatus Zambryskibacteria bacterium CG10_big_fil_rev_8_21_14_0_10_34_34]|uniref:Large ribosomal subunit protein bL21 n=1 Tax=Candidatus Zambryskibacteria bacterium CG10_big_fil_rev_8_21_14_0_10_34_34 TaxID=1975114 RepID=A0A2H0R171_9BACT|nr:MAG: 50S ribosomal protein L21 [Candidatus Zambryskibacteria bacterium CG10_big_fil_rev_8_21_14_0_10_34_34]